MPDGNITKLNDKQARLITVEGYVFIITADSIKYIPNSKETEATYWIEWLDSNGNQLKREEKTGIAGKIANITEEDKILEGYTFDETNVNNILSGTVNEDGSTVLKIYFVENSGIYVALNGTTLSFFATESAAKNNAGTTGQYYGNINDRIFERTGDEVVGTLDNIPWKEQLDNITTVNIVDEIQPGSMCYYFADLKNCGAINGLSKIKTDNVTSMKGLFQWCGVNNASLTTIDISTFNTKNVTNMAHMFDRCRKVQTIKLPTNMDTRKVTSMRNMFNNILLVKNIDISKFDTNNVTDMYGMFYFASALTQINFPQTFNTSKVTNMSCMFSGCKALTSIDLSKFDTSKVTDMNAMFSGCSALQNLNVTNFVTDNVADMNGMFANCEALTSLNLNNFKTDKVIDMSNMFYKCYQLTSLDLSAFNTSNVTNMWGMFLNCISLKTLNVSSFDTSKVTDMHSMFNDCRSLTKLDLSNFSGTSVLDVNSMFCDCMVIESINLLSFNPSKATDISHIFADCYKLKTLNISNFSTQSAININEMFAGVENDTEIITNATMKAWLNTNYSNLTNIK